MWFRLTEDARKSSYVSKALRGLVSELPGEQPRSSEDRRDLHRLREEPVNNSKLPDDNLTNVRCVALRHHPSRFWKVGEALNGREDALEGEVGVVRRVFGDGCR